MAYSLIDMYARIVNKLEIEIENQDQGNEETVMEVVRISTVLMTED